MTSRERKAAMTARTSKIIELISNRQWVMEGRRRADGTLSEPRLLARDDITDAIKCACPAFEKTDDCRHVGAIEYMLEGGDVTYYPDLTPDKRPIYPQDNPRRKAARRCQEKIAPLLVRDLAQKLFPRVETRRRGRPPTGRADVIVCAAKRIQHCKSGDLAHAYVQDDWENKLLQKNTENSNHPPSVEALTNNMTKPGILKAIFMMIAAFAKLVAGIPEAAAVDGCEYNIPARDPSKPVPLDLTKEQARKFQMLTVKLHIAVGVVTGMILSARVTTGKKHESKKAIALAIDALRVKPIPTLLGDKGYWAEYIIGWLQERGIEVIIPPKSKTKLTVGTILGDYAIWWHKTPSERRRYGRRQRAECANASDKRLNYENLRSKKAISQAVELLCHVLMQQARTAVWLYLNGQIDDIPFMSERCRRHLDNVKKHLVGRARPDLKPRYRDGLREKEAA